MKKTGAERDPFFLYLSQSENMNNTILTTVFAFAGVFLFQGMPVFAAMTSQEIISLVNQEREQAGLPGLARSDSLDHAAEAKADDMAAEGYFSHTSPEGVTPWEWFRAAGYEYRYAGENLAIHFHTASSQERAWMESRTHCENILSPKYREIGAAVRPMIFEGKETTVAVQMFGTQMTDEKNLHLSEKGSIICPKRSPSFLNASMPDDARGGMIGSVSRLLSREADHYRIDAVKLSLLALVSLMQVFGLVAVMFLSLRERWLRKW